MLQDPQWGPDPNFGNYWLKTFFSFHLNLVCSFQVPMRSSDSIKLPVLESLHCWPVRICYGSVPVQVESCFKISIFTDPHTLNLKRILILSCWSHAGVVLTLAIPAVRSGTGAETLKSPLVPMGSAHGHTGHVRFLTSIELPEGFDMNFPPTTTDSTGFTA